jgi:hypothetical protein
MMIFGDPSDFAIEAMIESDLTVPSAVWGRMRIWCQEETIGDYNEPFCALYPAYLGFNDLQQTISTLRWNGIEEMTNAEIWNFLDGLLYGYQGDVEIQDDRPLEQMQKDATEYGKFNFLTNWGEQFDQGGKSFIVCKDGRKITILNRSLPAKYDIAVITSKLALNNAISLFLSWFDNEARRLSGESI